MLRTGHSPPLRIEELVAPLRQAGSLPPPGASLLGILASPQAGLSPAGRAELVARVFPWRITSLSQAPELAGRTPGNRGKSTTYYTWRDKVLSGAAEALSGPGASLEVAQLRDRGS